MPRVFTVTEDEFLNAADVAIEIIKSPWKTKFPYPVRANFGPTMAKRMCKKLRVALALMEEASGKMDTETKKALQKPKRSSI